MLSESLKQIFEKCFEKQSPEVQELFNSLDLKLGCDPELYLYNTKKKRIVPANGLVPGDKHNPHLVPGGNVQLDGTVLEIGTDPASSADEFLHNIRSIIEWVRNHLGEDYEIRCGSNAKYYSWDSKKLLDGVLEVGCSAQYFIRCIAPSSYQLVRTLPSNRS
jgi:hypothetical protein